MLDSRDSSRRNAIQNAITGYHITRGRDALNEALEGAVGECKEHAAQTVYKEIRDLRDEITGIIVSQVALLSDPEKQDDH